MASMVVLGARGARADERVERAREHYVQGNAYYKLDKYQDALAEYEQAYIAKADPSFLFNIAQCHRLMGKRAEALKFYRRYLVEDPSSPNRAVAEKHIHDLESTPAPAAGSIAPGAAPTPGGGTPGGSVTADRDAPPPSAAPRPLLLAGSTPTAAPASPPPAVLEQSSRPDEDRHPIYTRWWFWAAVGAVAVAATAVTIGATAGGGQCDSGRICM